MNEDLIEAEKDLVELRMVYEDLLKQKQKYKRSEEFHLWEHVFYKSKSAIALAKYYIVLTKED